MAPVIQIILCLAGLILPIYAQSRGLLRLSGPDDTLPRARSLHAVIATGALPFAIGLFAMLFAQALAGTLAANFAGPTPPSHGSASAVSAAHDANPLEKLRTLATLTTILYTVTSLAALIAWQWLRTSANRRGRLLSPPLSHTASRAGLNLFRSPNPEPAAPGARPTPRLRSLLTVLGQSAIALVIILPACALASTAMSLIARAVTGISPDPIAHDTLRILLSYFNPADPAGSPTDPSAPLWIAAIIAGAVIGAPIVEEFMFRTFAQSSINALTRCRWAGVCIASILFVLVHIGAGSFAASSPTSSNTAPATGGIPWYALPPLFILSLGLGIAYERTGRIAVPILIHAGFNAVNLLVALLIAHQSSSPSP